MSGHQPEEALPNVIPALEASTELAVSEVYRRAGLIPGALGPIAPLRRLVANCGLVVEEIKGLSRATVARHFAEIGGPTKSELGQESERLSGYLYANAAGGWILTELEHPLVRRRFTIAHEIGHYVLHFLPALETVHDRGALELREELTGTPVTGPEPAQSDGTVALEGLATRQESPVPALEQMESEADRFAAELLLPAEVVRELVAKHAPRCGARRAILARMLAGECLVSTAAMSRRLDDLKLAWDEPKAEVRG